jgi:hypothetical protein
VSDEKPVVGLVVPLPGVADGRLAQRLAERELHALRKHAPRFVSDADIHAAQTHAARLVSALADAEHLSPQDREQEIALAAGLVEAISQVLKLGDRR